MKFLVFLTIFLSSLSAFASTVINVPAEEILKASRTIVAQTGPGYFVEGEIKCSVLNTGWAPTTSSCIITIKGIMAEVSNPDNIIQQLMELKAPTGPSYIVFGKFEASSISSEFPPYKTSEKAKIIFK